MAQNRWWIVVILLALALGISLGHNLALSYGLTGAAPAAPAAEACAPCPAYVPVAPIVETCKSAVPCPCATPAPARQQDWQRTYTPPTPAVPEGKPAPSGQPKQYFHFYVKISCLYKGDGIEADVAKAALGANGGDGKSENKVDLSELAKLLQALTGAKLGKDESATAPLAPVPTPVMCPPALCPACPAEALPPPAKTEKPVEKSDQKADPKTDAEAEDGLQNS